MAIGLAVLALSGCDRPAPGSGGAASEARRVSSARGGGDRSGSTASGGGSTKSVRGASGPTTSGTHPSTSAPEAGGPASSEEESKTAPADLVASVEDANPDREGDTPGFIEITRADVSARSGRLTMAISTADPLPRRLDAADELALFAFDIEMETGSWSLFGQLTHDGWTAELKNDRETHEVRYEVEGRTVRLSFPWRLVGSGSPGFSWTAATSMLRFHGAAATPEGGDAAPSGPAAFPPSSSEKQ